MSGGDHNPNPSAHDHKQNPRDVSASGGVTDYQGVDMSKATRRIHHRTCLLYDLDPNITSGLHQSRDCRCPAAEPHPCGHVERLAGCGGCDPGAVEFVRDDFGPWRRVDDAGVSR